MDELENLAGKAIRDLRDQIEAFLGGEAGDDPDDRDLRVGIFNTEGGQQILLALCFLGEILRREFRHGKFVGLGAPFVVVDAVQNSCNG